MRICKIEGEKGLCGRPAFTNANDLCEKHYMGHFQKSFIRIKDERYDCDPNTEFIKANKTHVLPQVIEAYGQMYQMRDLLTKGTDKTLTDWFNLKHIDNPLRQQALETALKIQWEHESGNKPMNKAFAELGAILGH